MSNNLTPQQKLLTFLNSLLQANLFTKSWVDFWNPNTHINRGLQNPMFRAIDKESRAIFKQILQKRGVVFEQNGNMMFLKNIQDVIHQIVDEFMRLRSPQATVAVADAPIRHAVCAGGGGAVAEASSPPDNFPNWVDRSGWSVPLPRSRQVGSGCAKDGGAVSESHDDKPKVCPNAGGRCQFHETWDGCRDIHPKNDPKSGELPENGGPTIMLCKNGPQCKYGDNCGFPHPTNGTCVVVEKNMKSGPVLIAKVCTLKKCDGSKCPRAHLPQNVIEKALERKKNAFSMSSRGAVACSAVDCNSSFDNSEDKHDKLRCALDSLSIEKPVCFGHGRGACAVSFVKPQSEHSDLMSFVDKLSLDNLSTKFAFESFASAPPEILEYGSGWIIVEHAETGLSYYQNVHTGITTIEHPSTLIMSACCEVQADVDPLRACCEVVRQSKVREATVSQKASKRSSDFDSGPESSKKGRQ